jgi:hypothetical protein
VKDAFLESITNNHFQFKILTEQKIHMEIVHSDIFGPMQTLSIEGSTYFLTFIDDFSRKTWIYFLKHKSDALGCFQQSKSLVEKHSGYYIKCLRTGRGGEYILR